MNTAVVHLIVNIRKWLSPKPAVWFSILLSYLLILPSGIFAQASHAARVTVNQIAVVGVSTGVVSLSITGAGVVAGVDPMTVTDQSTVMTWGANTSTAKIAVKSSLALALQKYTLQVQAININGIPSSAGITAPVVTLTTVSNDFLTGIGLKRGTCNLLYTGIAPASKGVGTDSHTTITFTITN